MSPLFGWFSLQTAPRSATVHVAGDLGMCPTESVSGERCLLRTPIPVQEIDPGSWTFEVADRCYVSEPYELSVEVGEYRPVLLNMEPILTGIDVRATDSENNDLVGTLRVDGREVGTVPGKHKIPLRFRSAEVQTKRGVWWGKIGSGSTTCFAWVRVCMCVCVCL